MREHVKAGTTHQMLYPNAYRMAVGAALLAAIVALALGIWSLRSRAERTDTSLKRETATFKVGESEVHVKVTRSGKSPLILVHLHEDERVAARAGALFVEKHGGTLIHLSHSGTRRVSFALGGFGYSFDPNRIFTDIGVQRTLRGKAAVAPQAYAAVRSFAGEFIRAFSLDQQRALVALHNNGPGGYSIRSYLPGAPLEEDAGEVFVSADADLDDFYYVTDRRFFDALKRKGCNVVLQHFNTAEDDGSLSIFAAQQAIPYINVETEDGRTDKQLQMLEIAAELAGRK